MTQYRRSISDGVLIWEKRKLFPRFYGWSWVFVDSDENYLNDMLNELLKNRANVSALHRRIPVERERIKKAKERLQEHGHGDPTKRGWRWGKKTVRLLENLKVGQKKKDRDASALAKAREPVTLANITTPRK